MVSSTEGSSTITGWKRRSRAGSFSMYLRYSSMVVAPTMCSSPRASMGLSMLPASMAPSAAPAPTTVCISSMNRMISPAADGDLFEHRFQALFELAAVLGAGDQGAHIQLHQALVLEAFGHVAVDDALGQALRRWRSCPRPGRRSGPGCSWCGGKGSARRGGSPRPGR